MYAGSIFSIFENLILPIILIITGRVLWKHPSIDIEIRIGRKSTLCIEDEEKKERIREYCGKVLEKEFSKGWLKIRRDLYELFRWSHRLDHHIVTL